MARNDRAVAKASILMSLDAKQFKKGVQDTEKAWRGMTERIQRINSTVFNNSQLGQSLVGGLNNMTGAVGRLSPALRNVGGMVAGFARSAAMAGGVLATGLAAGLGASVKAAADLEGETLTLREIMGNEAGTAMADWVRSFYPNTSGSRSVFMQAAADLARLGMQAPQIQQMLQAMGDAGALSKLGADAGVNRLTEAFRTLYATGSLTERTLRQFRAVGVDYMDILTQRLGSFEAAQEAVKSGSISAAEAQIMFLAYMGQYYGAMQNQSATTAGTLGTIRAQLTEIMAGIGQAFLPALQVLGGYVSDFLTYCMQNLPNLQALISQLVTWSIDRIEELAGAVARLADNINGVITTLRELVTGHWRFTESRKLAGDIVEAEQSGSYIKTRAKQMAKDSGLNDILAEHGFAPQQIAAGMAAAAAQRSANDLIIAQNRANYQSGGAAFEAGRIQEDMLSQLQGINDKLDYIGGQNNAVQNGKIPVRGAANAGGVY